MNPFALKVYILFFRFIYLFHFIFTPCFLFIIFFKAFENKSHSSTAAKKQINPKMLKKTELKKVQAEEKIKEDIQQSLEDDLFIPPSVSAESLLTSPVTSLPELKGKK